MADSWGSSPSADDGLRAPLAVTRWMQIGTRGGEAEKQRSRDEERLALESGQKSREQLQRENALS